MFDIIRDKHYFEILEEESSITDNSDTSKCIIVGRRPQTLERLTTVVAFELVLK